MSKKIRVPVSHVDATWLGMDEPTNPMIINCVMLLSEKADYDDVVTKLNKRMIARHSRFSQRVVNGTPGFGSLQWETDVHFDIRSHVHHLALPDPGDKADLQRLISMLMSEPLDRMRPLWRMYLIDNVEGGSALYGRLHHAIGDGIALMQVLLSLTDAQPGTKPTPVTVSTQAQASDKMPNLFRNSIHKAGWAVGALVGAARSAKADPVQAHETARTAVDALRRTGVYAAATSVNLARLALMSHDRRSVYRGDLTPIKRIAWTEPIALARVKRIGKASGTTINDVLVACVAGGLRRFMIAADGAEPRVDIRATIPVNLRPAKAPLTLGNKFSLVFLTLPITEASAQGRLQMVQKRMNALKQSPEPVMVYEVLNVLGMIPGPVSRMASSWFASKASCILTNVPGPRYPVYFTGKRVDRMLFWVPQSRGVGMGVSILSYAGDVTIGLVIDDALVQDPDRIVCEFHNEFRELERLADECEAKAEVSVEAAAPADLVKEETQGELPKETNAES